MRVDSALTPRDKVKADICIIGAGPAGISIASQFLGSNVSVALLESGSLGRNEELQTLSEGSIETVNALDDKWVHFHSARRFGGTADRWAGQSREMDEIDFLPRKNSPHHGWPFTKKELLPWYKKAKEFIGIPDVPEDQAINGTRLKIKHYSRPDPVNRFKHPYWEQFGKSENITLFIHTTVTELVCAANGNEVIEAHASNFQGHKTVIKAKLFILACGGIGNPRLMLASNRQLAQGIGNQHDNVGRYFMEHFETIGNSANLWLRDEMLQALSPQHKHDRPALCLDDQTIADMGLLNFSGAPTFLGDHPLIQLQYFYKYFPRLYPGKHDTCHLALSCEQSPNPESRVMLSDKKDPLGVPRPHIDLKFSEIDHKSIEQTFHIIATDLGKTSRGRMIRTFDSKDPFTRMRGGGHLMGATRMHNDEKFGVTNANAKVYGHDNLYIAGSSLFPSAGFTNPTLTLVALAIRLAEHIRKQL